MVRVRTPDLQASEKFTDPGPGNPKALFEDLKFRRDENEAAGGGPEPLVMKPKCYLELIHNFALCVRNN